MMKGQKVSLPPLPYDYTALKGVLGEEQIKLHHDKHQAAYVKNSNNLLQKLEKKRQGKEEESYQCLLSSLNFNLNGAILHAIYWKNMRPPQDNNKPGKKMRKHLEDNFDSFESFKEEFTTAAGNVEGSGWGVLWMDADQRMLVGQVEKHNVMGYAGLAPILVVDVWEHAYYLDYQNKRDEYIKNWWKAVNWEDVERRTEKGRTNQR